MIQPQYRSPPTPARAHFHAQDAIPPATGYADASSDRVQISAMDKTPDIGHATSFSKRRFPKRTYHHRWPTILVSASHGKDRALLISILTRTRIGRSVLTWIVPMFIHPMETLDQKL